MIRAKHHPVIYPLFQLLTRYLLKRKFNSVHIGGDFDDDGNAVLVIANHISWWDGFWIMYVNLRIIRRRFHFMMLEEQLKKHWYFQYTGGFSVRKKSRSIVESIRYTTDLLSCKENMVFMFPQGEINSIYNHSIRFEKGAQHIIDAGSDDLQVVFIANFIDYFSDTRPNLYIYLQKIPAGELKNNQLEQAYSNFYTQALLTQQQKVS